MTQTETLDMALSALKFCLLQMEAVGTKESQQRYKDAIDYFEKHFIDLEPKSEWLEQAFREGWAGCRDAEFVGEEEEDWVFGNSTANSRTIDLQQAQPKEPEQEPVAWGADQAYAEGRGDYEVAQIRTKKTNWKLFGELSPKEQSYWVAKAAFGRATTPPQRKPLTDEQTERVIQQVEQEVGGSYAVWDTVSPKLLVRAILKAAHGIKE